MSLAMVGTSLAYPDDTTHPGIALEAGAYLPTSSALQDALGKQITTFSFGPGVIANPRQGTSSPEFAFITARKNGNKLFIVPLTLGYQKNLGAGPDSQFVPYVKVGAGIAYYDYSIRDSSGVKTAAKRFGLTSNVAVGLVISKRLTVQAQYNVFSKADGLDFNGLRLTASFTLFGL